VTLQGRSTRLRRLGWPQGVHQVISGDGAALGQRQERQYSATLRPPNINRRTVDEDTQRPEDIDPDH
jgi:hypothetical protein